jgi:hypothetical protein
LVAYPGWRDFTFAAERSGRPVAPEIALPINGRIQDLWRKLYGSDGESPCQGMHPAERVGGSVQQLLDVIGAPWSATLSV